MYGLLNLNADPPEAIPGEPFTCEGCFEVFDLDDDDYKDVDGKRLCLDCAADE